MDYKQAARLLPIDKHKLDDELERHADIAAQVSAQLAAANADAQRAKDALARTEARVWATIKDSAEKLSAAEIEGRVTRSPARIADWEIFQTARRVYEEWLGMAEAWKQRSYMITKLADLYSANYFSLTLTSTVSPQERDRPAWQNETPAQAHMRNLSANLTPAASPRALLIKRKAT